MRGFAMTPVLFVGLILIVGMMLLTFMDMDFRASEGIAHEGRLNKLAGGYLENRTSAEVSLFYYSALSAAESSAVPELESRISGRIGHPVHVTGCSADGFDVYYDESYTAREMESSINRTYRVEKRINCDAVLQLVYRNVTLNCGTEIFRCFWP